MCVYGIRQVSLPGEGAMKEELAQDEMKAFFSFRRLWLCFAS
jgi:hypothetical protein